MKKIYRLGLTLGATISIVAPLATVVACGSKEKPTPDKPHTDALQTPKTSLNLKDVKITEYDVERQILNTAKNGVLPLSRIQHTFESKDYGPALTKMDETKVQVMGIVEKTGTTRLETTNSQLIEHAKIFIDPSVQINGKSQSLDNPLISFTITKSDIMKNADAYQKVSDNINEYISQHSSSGEKYSVLTLSTKEDVKDTNDEFSTGEYKINIYQKPSNSANLDKAIALLKSDKFGSDENALAKLNGFTLTPITTEKNSEPNKSIYSNYIQAEQGPGTNNNIATNKDLYTNKAIPRVFDKNALIDQSVIGDTSFTSTEAVNGSSSFQFASKNIADADMDFLDKNVSEVANLAINKKTNQIMLEMTVTTVNDATLTYWGKNNTYSDEKILSKNYETGSVETVYIDLPVHTSWLKNDASAVVNNDDIQNIVLKTIADSSKFYKNLLVLCSGAETAESTFWVLQGVIGQNLKMVLLDSMIQLEEGQKYDTLLHDKNAFNDFISFASKNSGFDKNTLNQVLTKFSTDLPDGIPTDATSAALSGELNSSLLYTTVAYSSIFYNELEKFTLSSEGQQYSSLIKTVYRASVNKSAPILTDANWDALTPADFNLTPATGGATITSVAAQGSQPYSSGKVDYEITLDNGDKIHTSVSVTVPQP